MMNRRRSLGSLAALLTLIGCNQAVEPQTDNAAKTTASTVSGSAATEACPDTGPRLPVSGICQSRGVEALTLAAGNRPEAPEGCDWVLNEAAMPADDVLLYMALRCNGVTTTLDFAAGAKTATLTYATSAMGGDGPDARPVVTVIGADESAPQANLLQFTRDAIEDAAQREKCVVRPLNDPYSPTDALVVDDPSIQPPSGEMGEAMCGAYGYAPDSVAFWRVFGGFAWHFDLGQDAWQIDPGSFTLAKKSGAGAPG